MLIKSKWHDEFVKQLHEGLKLSLRAYNAVDFDSLISLTVRLFQNFPDQGDEIFLELNFEER